jgi:ubiquinone/menaquinone biosynthesis C-methylase UbiE
MTDETQRLRAARSYDGAARAYERVNAPKLFDPPARALVEAVAPSRGDRVLDVGCGTGAVSRAARAAMGPDAFVVAIDPSSDMLAAARRGGIDRVVLGSFPSLPFRDASFDVVLSAFVLTHVEDADAALAETARVLRARGRIGLSAWSPGADAYAAAWSEVVGRYVAEDRMTRACDVILPNDARFSQPNGVADALRAARFSDVHSHDVDFEFRLSVEEYIEGREVCAVGRALSTLLPDDEWRRFRADARATLGERFPDGVAYTRRVFIATGRLPVR